MRPLLNRAAEPVTRWLERRGWLGHAHSVWKFMAAEALLLLAALVVLIALNSFTELADDVNEGDTQGFDEWVLRSLRRADDPAVPIGPQWLHEVGIDLTALGSSVVVFLFTGAVVGFLLIQRRYRLASLVVVSVVGGLLVNFGLKQFFDRDRPTVVPHLRDVLTPSFPSGHAALSAVVYLTLAALLMPVVKGRIGKLYVLSVAALLALLVGASRVYLGVHYPTDVMAGWTVGLMWALLCYIVARLLHLWGALRERRRQRPMAEERWDDPEQVVLKI